MFAIAIDGACRRNGKPDCVSAGGAFVVKYDDNFNVLATDARTDYEIGSTNQRGEMLACIAALDYMCEFEESAQIITDSEYLFNALTKEWYNNWAKKGWVTAGGSPVKNRDIWERIVAALKNCEACGVEPIVYHVKGHVMSFGKVTAGRLLTADASGRELLVAVEEKFDSTPVKQEKYNTLLELSEKNNGFKLDSHTARRFITMNTVVDALATQCVEAADAMM